MSKVFRPYPRLLDIIYNFFRKLGIEKLGEEGFFSFAAPTSKGVLGFLLGRFAQLHHSISELLPSQLLLIYIFRFRQPFNIAFTY
jgi:hypothetical protein